MTNCSAGAFVDHFALVDQIGAVHQLEGLAHVVVGDQDAQPALLEPAHDLLHLVDRDRVDAAERLVQQQQLGAGDQRAGDLQPPLFAAAQRVGLALGQARQVQFLQQVLQPHRALLALHPAGFQDGQDVLLDRELAEDRRFLRQVADAQPRPLVHRQPGDIAALELHRARHRA